jgi:hypothetical protein
MTVQGCSFDIGNIFLIFIFASVFLLITFNLNGDTPLLEKIYKKVIKIKKDIDVQISSYS